MSGKPTLVSLFAGCGGSSLGYKWAGFKELLAVEWDNNTAETFRLNFPDVPVWQRDIREIRGEEILEFCSLKKRELDLLDGSPPCQGFSTAGKRKILDVRNDLFRHNIRLIEELEPKVFVIENVSGMIKGRTKGLFKEYMRLLKKLPYQLKCKLMNAKYYNVPQSRQRLIWIGVREDLDIKSSYPEPNNKLIMIREALKDCPKDRIYYPQKKAKSISCRLKQWQDGSDIIRDKFFNLKKLALNRPSRTITKTIRLSQCGLLHPNEDRFLTISELKRLSTFPDNYKFIGKFEEQWAGIGNSVPPKMMEAIAGHIKDRILSVAHNN